MEGTNSKVNGICVEYTSGGWACQAVARGGGAAGDFCDFAATKENGPLCDANDLCFFGGLCSPICNAGTSGAQKDGGNFAGGCDAGRCVATFSGGGMTIATGRCLIDCDFAAPDGGGCLRTAQGPAQKCLPLNPDLHGVCVAALDLPLAIGEPCDPTAPIDPCVAGAGCFGPLNDAGADFQCVQLCRSPRSDGGCPAGLFCQPLSNSISCGYCFP